MTPWGGSAGSSELSRLLGEATLAAARSKRGPTRAAIRLAFYSDVRISEVIRAVMLSS